MSGVTGHDDNVNHYLTTTVLVMCGTMKWDIWRVMQITDASVTIQVPMARESFTQVPYASVTIQARPCASVTMQVLSAIVTTQVPLANVTTKSPIQARKYKFSI